MDSSRTRADEAALNVYFRSRDNGSPHELALNVAVSVWFARCPWIDGREARARVTALLDEAAAREMLTQG